MSMEAFILGTGGVMPLPGRFLTSVLLRREGELFLFDCGEGTQVSLRRLNLRWKKISVILVSHTHADHVTGLPGLLMLSSQVERNEPLYIIGPPRIQEYVETSRRVLEMYINYEIVVKEIREPEVEQEVYRGDSFSIRSVPLNHSRVCVGYVLEEDPRPGVFYPERAEAAGVPRGPLWSQLQHGTSVEFEDGRTVRPADVMGAPRSGRKFSYITDTLRTSGLPEAVHGCDLLICEGMYRREDTHAAHEKKHMTAVEAAEVARDAGGVRRMGLIHYSPRYTEWDLRELLKEAKEIFGNTFLAKDGKNIRIPYPD